MPIRTLSRAIKILECVHGSAPGLILRDIADSVGLSKATAYRFVQALLQADFLRLEPKTSRYFVGAGLLRFGKLSQEFDELRVLASPYLDALRKATLETVTLVVPVGAMRRTISVHLSEYELRAVPELGALKPLHTGAAGKAMLAWYSDEDLEGFLAKKKLIPVTPHTITSAATLRRDLVQVRARGYAVSTEETVIGQAASAAPVFHPAGTVIAAINISGPVVRLPMPKLQENGEKVARIAAEFSNALQSKLPPRRAAWAQ